LVYSHSQSMLRGKCQVNLLVCVSLWRVACDCVTSWLIQFDELTVWRVGRVTSWLWRVDFLTSWPCDELVMWRVDWQPLSPWISLLLSVIWHLPAFAKWFLKALADLTRTRNKGVPSGKLNGNQLFRQAYNNDSLAISSLHLNHHILYVITKTITFAAEMFIYNVYLQSRDLGG